MKKIAAVLLMLTMTLCCTGAMALPSGIEYTEVDGIGYLLDTVSKTAELSKGKDTASAVIPATIPYGEETYKVTSIGQNAFYACNSLVSVDLPDNLKSIGEAAFASCYKLKSAAIPDSVESIGEYAFYQCLLLTGVDLPANLTSIGGNAFYGCCGLTSVTIPKNMTEIPQEAFKSCDGLKSVTFISETPPAVYYDSFGYCDALEAIYVPEGSVEAYKEALQGAMYKWDPVAGPNYCPELVVGYALPQPDDPQPDPQPEPQPEPQQPAPQQSADLPKTGDASMLGAWIALLGISAAGMKLRRKNG